MLATSKRSICPETIIVVNHALNTTSSDGGRNSFVQRLNDRLQIPAVDRTGVQGSHWLPRMGLVYYTAIDDFSKYARPGCLRLSVKSYTNRRSYPPPTQPCSYNPRSTSRLLTSSAASQAHTPFAVSLAPFSELPSLLPPRYYH